MTRRQPTSISVDIEPNLTLGAIDFQERHQQMRRMRSQYQRKLMRRGLRYLTAWMR